MSNFESIFEKSVNFESIFENFVISKKMSMVDEVTISLSGGRFGSSHLLSTLPIFCRKFVHRRGLKRVTHQNCCYDCSKISAKILEKSIFRGKSGLGIFEENEFPANFEENEFPSKSTKNKPDRHRNVGNH